MPAEAEVQSIYGIRECAVIGCEETTDGSTNHFFHVFQVEFPMCQAHWDEFEAHIEDCKAVE